MLIPKIQLNILDYLALTIIFEHFVTKDNLHF
jgi:hypothetical protein